MHSYHVYFGAKKGISDEILLKQVYSFMILQRAENLASSFRILKMHNKGNFEEMPDYHLIVDYKSAQDLKEAFANMKQAYMSEPHKSLMNMVSTFKVAFSNDEFEREYTE